MFRLVLILTALAGCDEGDLRSGGAPASVVDSWPPDRQLIQQLEQSFPETLKQHGAVRLDARGRYYRGVVRLEDGKRRRFIEGAALEKIAGGQPGVHVGMPHPPVNLEDAGCAAIYFLYDVDARRFRSLLCNSGW